jgi:hypothetical protein
MTARDRVTAQKHSGEAESAVRSRQAFSFLTPRGLKVSGLSWAPGSPYAAPRLKDK